MGWLRLALALMLLIAAAGCASQAQQPLTKAGLVIAVPKGEPADALKKAAERYTRSGGETVQVEAIGTEAYQDQMAAVFLASLERYDLVYLPAGAVAKWAGYKAIRPMPFTLDQAAQGPWLQALTVQGQVYGVPVTPDPVVMWYRSDLLQASELSAPRDWKAFRQVAQTLNAPPERYGAVISGSEIDAAGDFAALLAGFGGQALSDTYTLHLTDDSSRQALAFYTALHTDGLVSPRADRFTRVEVQSTLRNGQASLGLAPLSARAVLQDCSTENKVCKGGQPLLAWAWLPGLAETSGVGDLSAWVLPLHAPHALAAERFAAWLSSADGAAAWAISGGLPAHRGVLANPPMVEASASGSQAAPGSQASPGNQAASTALARLETYYLTIPSVSNADTLLQAYSTAVHAALAGDQPPDQALQAAAEQMRRALRAQQ